MCCLWWKQQFNTQIWDIYLRRLQVTLTSSSTSVVCSVYTSHKYKMLAISSPSRKWGWNKTFNFLKNLLLAIYYSSEEDPTHTFTTRHAIQSLHQYTLFLWCVTLTMSLDMNIELIFCFLCLGVCSWREIRRYRSGIRIMQEYCFNDTVHLVLCLEFWQNEECHLYVAHFQCRLKRTLYRSNMLTGSIERFLKGVKYAF